MRIILLLFVFEISLVLSLLANEKESKKEVLGTYQKSLTWENYRRIQAAHAPEFALRHRFSDSDLEDGHFSFLGYRQNIRNDLSLLARVYRHDFRESALDMTHRQSHLFKLGLLHDRKEHQLYGEVELANKLRLGAGLDWTFQMKPGALIGLGIKRRSIDTNLQSIERGEVEDHIKSMLSFSLPSRLFLSSEFIIGKSMLKEMSSEYGHFKQLSINLGFMLLSQNERLITQQFYGKDMRYQSDLKHYIQVYFTQEWYRFHADQGYFSLLARTRRAYPSSLRIETGLPLSPKHGVRFLIGSGIDAQRDVELGKLFIYDMNYYFTPTNRSKFSFNYSYSTENTGVVVGDISQFELNFQVNL